MTPRRMHLQGSVHLRGRYENASRLYILVSMTTNTANEGVPRPGVSHAPPASTVTKSVRLSSRSCGTYPIPFTTPPDSSTSPLTVSVPFLAPVQMCALRMSVGRVPGSNLSEMSRARKSTGGPGVACKPAHWLRISFAWSGTRCTRAGASCESEVR